MNIIEKIKSFFKRTKIKALPEGRGGIITPEEALKQNRDLGKQEEKIQAEVKKSDKTASDYFNKTFVVEFKDDKEREIIYTDQLSHLSHIIYSYLEAKIATNNFNYADVTINPEEVALLIDYLKQSSNGAIEQKISIKLTSEQQKFYDSLTQQQQDTFNSLIVYSEGALEKYNDIDVRAIFNAISIYMENPPEKKQDVRYEDYKKYLATPERK